MELIPVANAERRSGQALDARLRALNFAAVWRTFGFALAAIFDCITSGEYDDPHEDKGGHNYGYNRKEKYHHRS